MIKYKYLPFTHNKPRYQGLNEQKWQLKAQSLPPSSPTSDFSAVTTATSEGTEKKSAVSNSNNVLPSTSSQPHILVTV